MSDKYVIGIDPGPIHSAFAVVDQDYRPTVVKKTSTYEILLFLCHARPSVVAIESIQSYGMPVGKSVFETCYTIGRLLQICDDQTIPWRLYPRPEYARTIAGGMRKVTDADLRRALLNRFGGDKKGEPLNILRGDTDKRSAFAVAVYHIDLEKYKLRSV